MKKLSYAVKNVLNICLAFLCSGKDTGRLIVYCGSYPISSRQVQLATAKLAICLKNSSFGVEKPSFLRGLIFRADHGGVCGRNAVFRTFRVDVPCQTYIASICSA